MGLYILKYIYTHIHLRIHTYVCMYIHSCVCVCIRYVMPPMGLLFRESPRNLKSIHGIAIVICCSPELNEKTLLLKRPHTLVAEQREIKL